MRFLSASTTGICAGVIGTAYCARLGTDRRFEDARFSAEFGVMMPKVIARADRGEPLERIAIEWGTRVVYLANPARIDAVLAGESNPIGFPQEDVFEFDEVVFADLSDQWARKRATEPATWQRLRSYSAAL